jgi:cell division protease FtsH
MFLGHTTTGAGTTSNAHRHCAQYGLRVGHGELGLVGKKEEAIFLGREIAQHRDFSEATAVDIDKEVKRIVSIAYESAKSIQNTHRDILERIAQGLLEREVLDANEVRLLIEGKPLPEKPRTPPTVPPQGAPAADPKVVRPELRPAPGFTREIVRPKRKYSEEKSRIRARRCAPTF